MHSPNVVPVAHQVSLEERWSLNGHRSGILWLTGLSAAGKSTLAIGLEQRLFRSGIRAYVLDGDNCRRGLTADLSFSPEDRAENIRRVGEAGRLIAEAGVIAICAFIAPYRQDRDRVRSLMPPGLFHEIYVKADLGVCEKRDPKGLYQRARRGEIPVFTGISAPYEIPEAPELIVDTAALSVERSLAVLEDYAKSVFAAATVL